MIDRAYFTEEECDNCGQKLLSDGRCINCDMVPVDEDDED